MTVLVHDYLLVYRGAERTFKAIADLYPRSPISTLFYDKSVFDEHLAGHEIRTSGLQRTRANQKNFHRLLPLLPRAAERLSVGGHDLVVSSSSAFAHGVSPDRDAKHVCYCHTPFRYAWYERARALQAVRPRLRPALDRRLDRIKAWDYERAQNATVFVANGILTQSRIREFWDRDAEIVHPPVEIKRFSAGTPEDFFLVVGELVRHKQIELALKAAAQADVPIKIVGGGTQSEYLRATYGHRSGVDFLGRVSDEDLASLYPRALAVVMPNVEEFGITSIEAQASGRPVLAAQQGGALETIVEGVTGRFFEPGSVDDLAAAMRHERFDRYDPQACTTNAATFSTEAFQTNFADAIARAVRLP